MATVGTYYDAIDSFAPFATAETWDNVGLLIGSRQMDVSRVLLALDVTGSVLEEAVALGANLIITHHPVIFTSISRLDGESLVYRAAAAGISVISAHTNLDIAKDGVNDALAQRLGLTGIRPLRAQGEPSLGRLGELPHPMGPHALAALVKERLDAPGVRYTCGDSAILTVVVCGGSGAELLGDARELGAQALVTGEAAHHWFLAAGEMGMTLVDGGHFATENPVLESLQQRLSALISDAPITVSKRCTSGVRYC